MIGLSGERKYPCLVVASLRHSVEHSADFHQASEQPHQFCRHQTVQRLKPADRIQMRHHPRDVRAARHEWARRDPLTCYIWSSAMPSVGCRCHTELPGASIRRRPKARRGPGFQRSKEWPQPCPINQPETEKCQEAVIEAWNKRFEGFPYRSESVA